MLFMLLGMITASTAEADDRPNILLVMVAGSRLPGEHELVEQLQVSRPVHREALARLLGRDDQARLDQYLTSVREIDERLHVARQWELSPKPTTDQQPPDDIRYQKHG